MSTRLSLALALSLAAGLAAASDPFDGLQFPDGKTRSMEQFHGQTVIAVWFCAH
jgi:hypothetical protein